jgi:hypothetical protein
MDFKIFRMYVHKHEDFESTFKAKKICTYIPLQEIPKSFNVDNVFMYIEDALIKMYL